MNIKYLVHLNTMRKLYNKVSWEAMESQQTRVLNIMISEQKEKHI